MRSTALTLVTWLVAVAAVAGPARDERARWVVWMVTGGVLEVASVEPVDGADDRVRLNLIDGGSIAVHVDQVARSEKLAPPPEAERKADSSSSCDPWTGDRVTRWGELVAEAAERHGISAELVQAIIAVESCGDPEALSPKGALGLMQLMPATAAENGCTDRRDPRENVDAGCRFLARLQKDLGELDLVLAAYNAGPGAVARHGGVPPYRETRAYVRKVKDHLSQATGT